MIMMMMIFRKQRQVIFNRSTLKFSTKNKSENEIFTHKKRTALNRIKDKIIIIIIIIVFYQKNKLTEQKRAEAS